MTQRTTNWLAIWISVAVVVVGVVVGAVIVWASSQTEAAPAPETSIGATSIVEAETGAIVFGDGPDVVETYVDFMCPFCKRFEEAEGPEIQRLIAEGKITLKVHPVAILDRYSQGAQFSSRAAAAMYAVAAQDPENAYAFFQKMFENQPAEGTAGLSDEEILQVAEDAGVEVTAELRGSITLGEYLGYARERALPEGAQGTPTLIVNGEEVRPTGDPQADIVARLG